MRIFLYKLNWNVCMLGQLDIYKIPLAQPLCARTHTHRLYVCCCGLIFSAPNRTELWSQNRQRPVHWQRASERMSKQAIEKCKRNGTQLGRRNYGPIDVSLCVWWWRLSVCLYLYVLCAHRVALFAHTNQTLSNALAHPHGIQYVFQLLTENTVVAQSQKNYAPNDPLYLTLRACVCVCVTAEQRVGFFFVSRFTEPRLNNGNSFHF